MTLRTDLLGSATGTDHIDVERDSDKPNLSKAVNIFLQLDKNEQPRTPTTHLTEISAEIISVATRLKKVESEICEMEVQIKRIGSELTDRKRKESS